MIKKRVGNNSTSLKHFNQNIPLTNTKDIVKTLADNLSLKAKLKLSICKTKQRKKNSQSKNTESYNHLFSLSELKESLAKTHNCWSWQHFEFLKQLPEIYLIFLENI